MTGQHDHSHALAADPYPSDVAPRVTHLRVPAGGGTLTFPISRLLAGDLRPLADPAPAARGTVASLTPAPGPRATDAPAASASLAVLHQECHDTGHGPVALALLAETSHDGHRPRLVFAAATTEAFVAVDVDALHAGVAAADAALGADYRSRTVPHLDLTGSDPELAALPL